MPHSWVCSERVAKNRPIALTEPVSYNFLKIRNGNYNDTPIATHSYSQIITRSLPMSTPELFLRAARKLASDVRCRKIPHTKRRTLSNHVHIPSIREMFTRTTHLPAPIHLLGKKANTVELRRPLEFL